MLADRVGGPRPEALRRELRAVAIIAVAVVAVSALAGVAWGVLAPAERLWVTKPGRAAVLTGESMHQFDGVAIFVLLGAALAALTAFAAWRVRAARGPALVVALLIASGLGAFAMNLIGDRVAGMVNPRPHDPPVGAIIALPAELGTGLALVVQPLLAGLFLLLLTALHPAEDLGTGAAGLVGDLYPPQHIEPADPVFGGEPAGAYLPGGDFDPTPQPRPH
ncbi:hypothetical protein ACFYTF_29710 [Nocardia thailandica]|uniref:DUF2567 domain-containing protein n=1 Tax=Nocardia thailandica TaxID=257275 RepID=A0ABW6PXK5_9NOCA